MCYFQARVSADIDNLKAKLRSLSEIFHLEDLRKELLSLEEKTADPLFWNDPKKAAEIQRRRSECAETVRTLDQLATDLADAEEFAPLVEQGDPQITREVAAKLGRCRKTMEELEFRRMLAGRFDHSPAILAINSGAGGTEAQDWVQMLLRMYLRWAERRGFKATIVDTQPGEEAGLKNATVVVEGPYAYGYLSSEAGIHRLVRISPFDANARRHTSFASVMVLPEIEDDVEVEINEEDLRIDTYRSSGAGGQHVNKTDSAVRLTHIPTGIVVACQNERSQHKNKAQAMKILRARLFERHQEEKEQEKVKMAGEKKDIAFGSQIRSYVLQPYQLIKDHRTDHEVGNVQAVLDGDIDAFIRSYLLKKAVGQ
ncbi:MAG: peptide chain release factor 2 [Pseudomonadota bacterium]